MNSKRILLGTLCYTLGTFPLAAVWHVALFEKQYRAFGYLEGEPNFLLGLITIVIQGVMLSFLFPFVSFAGNSFQRAFKFCLAIGIFFWTSHVLAFVAKQEVPGTSAFISMETFYLALQFGLFGIFLGLIHRKDPGP